MKTALAIALFALLSGCSFLGDTLDTVTNGGGSGWSGLMGNAVRNRILNGGGGVGQADVVPDSGFQQNQRLGVVCQGAIARRDQSAMWVFC